MKIQVKLTAKERKQVAKIKQELKTQYANLNRAYKKAQKNFGEGGKVPTKLSKTTHQALLQTERSMKKAERFISGLRKKLEK